MLTMEELYQRLQMSKTVEEVEDTCRITIALGRKDSILGEALQDYPALNEHTLALIDCMHVMSVNLEKQTDQQKSIYDIMIDCMVLDCMMVALGYYAELVRRYEDVVDGAQHSKRKNKHLWDKQVMLEKWLCPNQNGNWMNNLRRDPLLSDIYQLKGECPPDLDIEFMRVLCALKEYGVNIEPDRRMLHPACVIPLLSGHPYFIYSVEKRWKLYEMLCDRDANAVDIGSDITSALLDYYGEKCEGIPKMLTEWYQLFESYYDDLFLEEYSVWGTGKFFDNYIELKSAIKKYQEENKELNECKAEYKDKMTGQDRIDFVKYQKGVEAALDRETWDAREALLQTWLTNSDFVSYERQLKEHLIQLLCSPSITKQIQQKLKNSKGKIPEYCENLKEKMEEASETLDFEEIYSLLINLFDEKSTLCTTPDKTVSWQDSGLTIQKALEQVTQEKGSCAPEETELGNLLDLVESTIKISQKHLQREKQECRRPLWYKHKEVWKEMEENNKCMEELVLYEPNDFIQAPCTKIFFVCLQRQLWPAFAGEEGRVEWLAQDDEQKVCTCASYYIGACVLAHVLEGFYSQLTEFLKKQAQSYEEKAKAYFWEQEQGTEMPEGIGDEDSTKWQWAKSILHHKNGQEKGVDIIEFDTAGEGMNLLQRQMNWFYSKNKIEQAVYTCQHVKFPYEYDMEHAIAKKLEAAESNDPVYICHIFEKYVQNHPSVSQTIHKSQCTPEQVVQKGKAYWNAVQEGNTKDYKDYLRSQLYLVPKEKLSN